MEVSDVKNKKLTKLRKKIPDPVVDHILEKEYDKETDKKVETSGLVTLMVPINHDDPNGDRPIYLNHNGHNYVLPRGKLATIPKELAQILVNASRTTSMVPKLGKTRHDTTGRMIGELEEEVHERFTVIIERED